jgi:glucose uptake protein GlcU
MEKWDMRSVSDHWVELRRRYGGKVVDQNVPLGVSPQAMVILMLCPLGLIILCVVPDYLTVDHVDNVLGNIGGMVCNPL